MRVPLTLLLASLLLTIRINIHRFYSKYQLRTSLYLNTPHITAGPLTKPFVSES